MHVEHEYFRCGAWTMLQRWTSTAPESLAAVNRKVVSHSRRDGRRYTAALASPTRRAGQRVRYHFPVHSGQRLSCQYCNDPRSAMRTRYTDVLAVTYSVFRSLSPNAQLAGVSGNSIIRTNFPAGV
jgi:hypothetical protein